MLTHSEQLLKEKITAIEKESADLSEVQQMGHNSTLVEDVLGDAEAN